MEERTNMEGVREASAPIYCTDYPITRLGDVPGKPAPVRKCRLLSYDGNKYCTILVDGLVVTIKRGYVKELSEGDDRG